MQQEKATEAFLGFKKLVFELLGLDTAALVSLDPAQTSVAAGLHEFMRKTLESALSTVWAPEGTTFRLLPDASATALRRLGWPDAKSYNLSCILAHALICAPRRARGLPYVPLSTAEANIIDFPRKVSARERRSTAELVAEAVKVFEVDIGAPGGAPLQSISICEQIQERLGLSPEVLARPRYDDQREAEDEFARDPEGQAIGGLAALLMTVLNVYQAAVAEEEIDTIRLLIVDDARYTGLANARYSNIVNLLIGALLAHGEREVAFLV